MSLDADSAQRLAQLSLILNDSHGRRYPSSSNPSDPAAEHLAALRPDRIQRITREIESRSGHAADELDRVAMRLLLDEYVSALVHLRAIANASARHVESVPAALKDVRRYVERERASEAKRRASAAPSD